MSENGTKTVERASARQVRDPELIAMHEIAEILDELDSDQQRRVMRWMASRYDPLPAEIAGGVPQF